MISGKKPVFSTLVLLAAAVSLAACSRTETGNEHFHTLDEEQISDTQYFPGDLPIPEGAGITFTEGELVGGKKSSMLIYETQESMAKLGTTYKKYIQDKELDSNTEIVDQNNMIISGKAPGSYSYSIIGSSSEAEPGGAEIIVTWIEN